MARRGRKPRFKKAKRHTIKSTDRARLNETVAKIRATNPTMSDAQSFWLAARQVNAAPERSPAEQLILDLRRVFGGAHVAITTTPGVGVEAEVRLANHTIHAQAKDIPTLYTSVLTQTA